MTGKTIYPANRGVDTILSFEGVTLGGQKNASLSRSARTVDVSNEIQKQWKSYLPAEKTWSLSCGGMVIKNQESFKILERAFKQGDKIDITLYCGDVKYIGSAYITSFPILASFSDTYTYNISLIGDGELNASFE